MIDGVAFLPEKALAKGRLHARIAVAAILLIFFFFKKQNCFFSFTLIYEFYLSSHLSIQKNMETT
jgi:hypothetical protein